MTAESTLLATQVAEATASTFLAGQLLRLRLHREFPFFLAFVAFIAISGFTASLIYLNQTAYFWFYLLSSPIYWLISIFSVRQLFTLVFEDYPGIRTMGRWIMYASVSLSVTAAVVLNRAFWDGGPQLRSGSVYYILLIQRSIVFSLAIFIISILFFLSRYPLRLRRSTRTASTFFGALFLSEAIALLLNSMKLSLHDALTDEIQLIFSTFCLVMWLLMLQPDSPREVPQINSRWSPAEEEHLLQQLNALNAVMSRAARQ